MCLNILVDAAMRKLASLGLCTAERIVVHLCNAWRIVVPKLSCKNIVQQAVLQDDTGEGTTGARDTISSCFTATT